MEVAWKGLGVGCRWFSLVGAMGIPAFILNPMVRTLAIERGHISPLELVQDRYRSHMLSVLLVGVLVTSLIIGCGTQLLAVKSMLLALTNDVFEAQIGTILVCVVAAFCEVLGGFRGVSRIDTCQMVTTIACAAAGALFVLPESGGLAAVAPVQCAAGRPGANSFQARSLMCQFNATGYPCENKCQCSGCYGSAWILDPHAGAADLGAHNVDAPAVDFAALVRHPHAWQGDYAVWKVFSLVLLVGVGGHGGSLAPHIFQRVVSADSDQTLKQTLLPVFPAGWVTLVAGLIYGVTWMGLHGPEFNFADDGTVLPGAAGPKQPLAGVFDDLIDLGGTEKLLGLVALSAAVSSLLTAACMTSMGCGSIIAIGIVRNLLWPIVQWGDARGDLKKGAAKDDDDAAALTLDAQTVIVSKVISTLCLFIALATITLSDDADLSEMFDWTVGLAAHATPAFWYSGANVFYLGRRVHSIALTLGLVFGLLGTATIQFYILGPDENGQVPELVLSAAAWGVVINWIFTIWFVLTLPGSLADTRQDRPKPNWLAWDAPTPQFLRKYGKNFLTFNEAERVCTQHAIPSHRAPVLYGALLAWALTVATLPWSDGGGESTTGLYVPPVPDSDIFGLPRYVVIQIGGAFMTMPIYVGLFYMFWDAPDHAVSGRLGAVSMKSLERMTVQDVSTWLFQFHQDERPRRNSLGKMQSMAWGVVLDHYIHVLRLKEVDGEVLKNISKTKLSAVSALVDMYGIADQEHAICVANEIHQLKVNGWITEDVVYSREWESKLKAWSRDSLDKLGCATALTPRQLNGPRTLSSRDVKRSSVRAARGVKEWDAADDDDETSSDQLEDTRDSIGRLDLADSRVDDYGDRADPLKHGHSKMYLRWDPYATDRATVLGEAAWTNALKRLKIGTEAKNTSWLTEESVLLDAEDGMGRVKFLLEFEKFTQPWEHASNHVVPWRPNDITIHNLTAMLHSKATKATSSACADAIVATWAVRTVNIDSRRVQGRLSRTCQIRCKYRDEDGDSKPGPGSLVAKFLPRQREFLASRRDYGAGGCNVFGTEVFVYEHELMTDLGIIQPKCFFEAHDPERDCFCIVMEDLQSAGFSSGDELSELGDCHAETGVFPSLPLYAEVVRVLADSNCRRYNTSQGAWTSPHNDDFDLGRLLLGFDSRAYISVMYRQLKDNFSVSDQSGEDTVFQNIGFKQLCLWLGYNNGPYDKCFTPSFERGVLWMIENQKLFVLASRSREDGGWLDCGIVHGDCRIDNIWFPTPMAKDNVGKGDTDHSRLRTIGGHCARFIDFQHVKRGCVVYDVTVFLAHSVPKEWRRTHEMQLLSLYFDAIQASQAYTEWVDSHPGEELTWEYFLLEIQFCLLHYMPSLIVTAATTVASFEQIDPKRFLRGGTFVCRFLEMFADWSPSPRLAEGQSEEQSAMQVIIEAAARRSRDVEEQRIQAGWTRTDNSWNPPAGSSGEVDWAALKGKWLQEALGSKEVEGLLPYKLAHGYVSQSRRDDAAKAIERTRFSAPDQDSVLADQLTAIVADLEKRSESAVETVL